MMTYGEVPGVGKPVSRLVLGTMIIHTSNLPESLNLLDSAWELGYTTLDCAHVYGGGGSERAVGQWLLARGNRDRLVIITKGCHPNADRKRVTPFDLASDLHDSLARLQTDYVDIYMLHRDDPEVPVGEIVEAFNEQLEAGRLRACGGSNWTHQRLQEAHDYALAHGLVPLTSSSPHYSLAEQVDDPWGPGCVGVSGPAQTEARQWYEQTQMALFAYSSLARGFFSGRLTRGNFPAAREWLDNACQTAYCHEVNFQRLDRAEILAAEKDVTVPQIALAYVMNQPLNLFALVGAANREELAANRQGAALTLTPAELAWLDLRSDRREG